MTYETNGGQDVLYKNLETQTLYHVDPMMSDGVIMNVLFDERLV